MSDSLILIGQCAGAWGLQGSLKIISWCMPKENIFSYDSWYLSNKRLDEKGEQEAVQITKADLSCYKVLSHKILRAGRSLAVNFEGIESIDEALPLQGKNIYIYSHQLAQPEDDEYYWHELIGMSVLDSKKVKLGQVSGMLSTGVHDVLRIQSDGDDEQAEKKADLLIPFVRERYVISVDRVNKIIVVNWDWS